MSKVIYALVLFAVATVANAVPVTFIVHNQTSGTTVSTLVSDGSSLPFRLPNGAVGGVTATFDWDGTTLSSTGNYGVATHIGSSPNAAAIVASKVTDLNIDTSTSSSSGSTSYFCSSGDFLMGLNINICGGYNLTDYVDDSTATWGPGLAVSRTIGGNDVISGPQSTINGAFDFGLMLWDGTTLVLGNGAGLGAPLGGEQICFSTDGSSAGCGILVPVPAAAWLFGSALGLLGWARRRVAL